MPLCEDWITTEDLESWTQCCDLATYDSYLVADVLTAASEMMHALLGQQFPGTCEVTVRPCASGCGCTSPSHRSCGCCGVSQVRLGVGQVQSIVEVLIDGAVLAPASYRLDDRRWLVRLPNVGETTGRSWPCCQRLDLPDSAEDTWSVTVLAGNEPPMLARMGAAKLSCELLRGMSGQECCFQPRAIEQLTREGTSYVINDPAALFDNGQTGITEVDLAIQTWNPNRVRSGGTVFSPDTSPASVQPG